MSPGNVFAQPWIDAPGQQAVFQVTVPAAGTPISAPGYRVLTHEITVRPLPTNTAPVFAIIGYGGRNRPGAQVIRLDPGSVPIEGIFLPSGNLSELQIDSTVNGEGVSISVGIRGGGGGRTGIAPQAPSGNLGALVPPPSSPSGGGGGAGGGSGAPPPGGGYVPPGGGGGGLGR